jgi:hypothetical protein
MILVRAFASAVSVAVAFDPGKVVISFFSCVRRWV